MSAPNSTSVAEFLAHLPTATIDDDAALARAIVEHAGALAARMRQAGVTTEFKTSVSDVVTAADRAAEAFVVAALAQLRPADGILGEEGSAKESDSGRTWVIDPVDGTYNFTTGSDYWCSALALVHGSAENPEGLIVSAVHRPATGHTWVGGPHVPTTRFHPQEQSRLLSIKDRELSQVSAGTYLHSTVVGAADEQERASTAAWLATVSRSATWRMLGSASLDLAGVAEGRLGVWFQRDVAAWDWLPGLGLIVGAGGTGASVGRWQVAGSANQVRDLSQTLH